MTDASETPDDLKQELADQLRWACAIFGQPSDLLRAVALAEWRRLRVWVRGLEALAARLVRALAATIPAATALASPVSTRLRRVRAERVAPNTEYPDSEHWAGVCVRLRDDARANPTPKAAGGGIAPAAPRTLDLGLADDAGSGFRSARRLALRLEAVIRVAENPLRYAQRLVRRTARPTRRTPRAGRRVAPLSMPAPIASPDPPLRPLAIETG